jgi:hypothetical protein
VISPFRGLPADPTRPSNVDENGIHLGPMRRVRGLTWVGWVNYLVLRWFLFRIYYVPVPRFPGDTVGKIGRYGLRFVPSWRW